MSSDKIRIDTDKLDDISQRFNRLSSSLDSINTSIAQVISSARSVVPEQQNIIRNITSLKNRVNSAGDYSRKVSTAVRNASVRWAEAEGKVAGTSREQGEEAPTGDGGGSSSSGKTGWDYLLEMLGKAVGGAGVVGKTISAIWSGITKGTAPDWAKSIIDIVGGVGKAIISHNNGTSWSGVLFGLTEYTKTFGQNMSNPITWAVNIGKAFIDNADFLAEGNVPRFVTESIAEGGTNVLLGAGGMALAAAILPAGAPVIAVAAVGAVAVWGVNTLVKTLTGNDIAGHVGNLVGEATDWVVEKGGQAIDWVAEKGGQAIDWVADKGQQLLDTGARVISDAGSAVCNFFGSIFA